ncbi:MAG: (2Fe-2S)-binding protein, partial [Anaerolineales bacterium]|nr:(2Fe-2S)-binding protein [Anaerolineales bacterium]
LGLGLHPRDALRRMGHDLPVRAVGSAARPSDIPPCPRAGVVCPCGGVSVADLQFAWDSGFREMELLKRATLAGTGTCQGSVCLPHLRSFLADRGEALQPPFTARPVTRQLTIGEVSAGAHHHATARTALDAEHRRLGARMERVGGWWRPWHYGMQQEEYWAVREAVSLGDVSTLGKFLVSGPDALELLERLYPTRVATIRPGRCRYVLLLDERGYVLDDGLICRDGDTRFTLTLTSGGATFAEMWLRDWADSWGLDVRLLNQTFALGAINVTGPLARRLLARAGCDAPPAYMAHTRATVAGVACRVYRLSFTGELSYELHHDAADSVTLWRRLFALGADLGVKPHGIETLLRLRLEKGHIIVGQDTDFDSTPRRIRHEWAVKLDKGAFVGRQAVIRTNKIPLDRQLAAFEMPGPAPLEGALIWHDGTYAGYVTSSTFSPVLGKAVLLGWLALSDGALPDEVTIDGRTARRTTVPFYDPEGTRARA